MYGVNSETRKLIKRSSRKGELKEKFDVREMSSISTLKVAWEHYPWGTYDEYWQEEMDETDFCERVTQTNKLELLKWAREEKNCEWYVGTIHAAAEQGNLEMVKYCVANECPIDNDACAFAALLGHLEVLKYLHKEAKAPWDSWTAEWAAENGHLHILEYLVERKYDKFHVFACWWAAEDGHFDCLKHLHETAKAPWDEWSVYHAHENDERLPRMCTIPPRQQLPITIWLAIRGWRVIFRIRIRIRIRRITSCNNTHTERDSIIIAYLFFFSKCTSSVIPHKKQSPTTTLPLCQYAQLFTFFHTLIISHQLTIFVYSCYYEQ